MCSSDLDRTDGFWRRFVILTFNRSFKGDPNRDPNIAESILAAERPAIVSWFIDGAVRLLKARGYTIPPSHEAAAMEAQRTKIMPVVSSLSMRLPFMGFWDGFSDEPGEGRLGSTGFYRPLE